MIVSLDEEHPVYVFLYKKNLVTNSELDFERSNKTLIDMFMA